MVLRLILFLILNFGALGIGGFFTGKGVQSDWYLMLNKAPWTPPGWVFGAAWTSIMICFSFYMAYLWPAFEGKIFIIGLFAFQWILNVAWNPVFFHFHSTGFAMILILMLTLLVAFLFFRFIDTLHYRSLLILPYLVWLLIACSLNAYVFFKN